MGSLERLFDCMVHYGIIVRSIQIECEAQGKAVLEGPNGEVVSFGQAAWQEICSLLDNYRTLGNGWSTPRYLSNTVPYSKDMPAIYQHVHDALDMKGDGHDDMSDNKRWETAHFYLQLARIPLRKPCTLRSLGQIAYNVGQLKMSLETYSPQAMHYYIINDLNKVCAYLDQDCTKKVDSQYPQLGKTIQNVERLTAIYERKLRQVTTR